MVALIFLWVQSRRAKGLSVSFEAPDQVLIGSPFEISVNISNDSRSVLRDARLSLILPDEIVFVGEPREKNIIHKDIGNLGVGSLAQEKFRLMTLSGENTIKKIQAGVIYSPASLGSKFEQKSEADLTIGGFGLPLDIVTPTKVFSGEDFETVISFKNVSDADYLDLKMNIVYPPNFNFLKASVELENSHREWPLGDLRRGSDNELKINGNLIGPDNAFFNFEVSIEVGFKNQRYTITANTATVSISPSPLSLRIGLNDDPNYVAKLGDFLHYTITYVNNTDIGLRDATIRAQLKGDMFDFSSLATQATFRSVDNTLVWNVSNASALALIAPGESGTVIFDIKTKQNYPIRRLNDKNFTLQIFAQIESPTVPVFVAAKKTINSLSYETKVAGQIKVDAKAYFRDAAAGIINEGPFPPRVSQPTQFTIHWVVTNFSTDVSEVKAKAFLGPNVRFTGVAKSNTGILPVYDAQTQEMTWEIDKIIATKGVVGDPLEAIFQVEAVPSRANVFWPLIQETAIVASDAFTGLDLVSKDAPVTTALPDDPTVVSVQQGIVKE